MRRRRNPRSVLSDLSPWALAIVAAIAAFAYAANSMLRESFLEPPWVVPSAPLVVTHVRPSSTVSLLVDPARGPAPLPADVEDRLSLLIDRRGLRVTSTPPAPLRVTDAAELANSTSALTSAIVGPVPGSRRALFVVSPIPRKTPSSYPTLFAAASAARGSANVACCASELEATLFALVWAAAGGGDAGSSPTLTIKVLPSIELVVDAAIALSDRPATLALVPIWACPGAPIVRAATARIRAATPGRGDASWRYVPYHPSDSPDADGRAYQEAPHQLHARAPSLRFEPVELVGGGGGGPGKDKKRLTLACAPTLVVMDAESVESVEAMAGLVAEALMYGDLGNTSSPVESSAAAECAALQALGGRLLGRTEELVIAASKRGLDAIVASPYGRPAVPILEQFGDGSADVIGGGSEVIGGSDALKSSSLIARGAVSVGDDVRGWEKNATGQTRDDGSGAVRGGVELSPVREITAEEDGITFRTVHYDEAGSGRGVIEASFSEHATLDGVRLRRGDRVELTSQERAIEQNGTFVLVDDRTMQSPVAFRPEAPFATALEMRKDGTWTWRFSEVADGGLGMRVGDELAWLAIPGAPIGRVVEKKNGKATVEVPASAVVASPKAAKFDRDWLAPLAVCSADPRVPTRQLCASKHPGAAWDGPCKRDADCPFASSSSSDGTYRGRCLTSGRCEVPIGAELVGWRSVAMSARAGHRPICACPGGGNGDLLSIKAASEACCAQRGEAVFELDRL